MSNTTLSTTIDAARRVIHTLNRKGVEAPTPRVEVTDGRAEVTFHLAGPVEQDRADITVLSEALDLNLTPSGIAGTYWASDTQEIGGVPVEITIFSQVYAVDSDGKSKLEAVK